MGGTTRHQEYRYQYKSVSTQNARTCGNGATMSFNLPSDFLEAKNLYCHIRVRFHASEPVGNQKILYIGQPAWPPDGEQPNMVYVNRSADGDRRIDLEIDLTQIIEKLEQQPAAFGGQGYFNVGILHPGVLAQLATVELWKMDLVYTTTGIR
jgi:hypothetical protein